MLRLNAMCLNLQIAPSLYFHAESMRKQHDMPLIMQGHTSGSGQGPALMTAMLHTYGGLAAHKVRFAAVTVQPSAAAQ